MDEPESNRETPFTRLRGLFSYAFAKADYDDPHRPEAPVELKEFGSNTVFVMAAGLLFGGLQQWRQERNAPPPTIPSAFSKAEKAKLIGELNTRKLIRLLNSTLRGGLWCGWLGAVYFGVEGLSAYARKMRDPWNTVMAGWACGCVFGLAVGGPGMMSRLRSAAGAVFLAGLVGYPVGYLQMQVNEKLGLPRGEVQREVETLTPLESKKEKRQETIEKKLPYPVRDYDVVTAVIGQLDQSIQDMERSK